MKMLEVSGLTKKYAGFALQNVSFSVEQGRIMGLIGKNGAGKSTTIKSILNMVRPNKGEVYMNGRLFAENQAICKQEIGVVFGGTDFYQYKKISDITKVTKLFYSNWDDAAYKKYIDMFELDPKKRVKELSSGMRVKYLIALALSHNAKLFILDEPTSGLDPVSRDDLLKLFQAIVRDGRRSVLFSTHITSDLEKCADDITYIKDGKLLYSDTKADFANAFQNLKQTDDETLSLEEIMIRTERREYYV